ncbi:MAG TPA: FtsX-like permease family protein [Clostridia bacterium]|nr:FtsX-like permease family protein [Clostridia bacterium]
MKILLRKLKRDLWQSKGQFISVLVLVIIGVMFYSGINATYRNLTETSEKYYKDYRMGDLWISFFKAPESAEEEVRALPFVKMATGRVVRDAKLDISGDNAVVRLISMPDTRTEVVNDIDIKSGSYFSDAGNSQCLVEQEFFEANGLEVGDCIYPVINGVEVKLSIAGSVKSPEFVYSVRDSAEIMPDNKRFGIVYLKKSYEQAIFGYEGSINDLSVILEEGTDIGKARDEIRDLLKDYTVTGITERKDQSSNRMLTEEIKGLQSLGGFFPILFFVVAAAIIYITMSRLVENQRTQIGVLKAFGFTDMFVLAHYLSYSVILAVTGSIIGSVFGMLLGKGFTEMENMYFKLPPADMKLYPELVLPATLLTLLFCLLAGYNSCKRVFRIMPSEAMKTRAPVKGRKILLERIGILWRGLRYNWKMVLRNIFRYKKRALLSSTGVIFAVAITFVSLSMNSSVNYLIDQQYSNIQDYDIKVGFSRMLNMEELNSVESLPYVKKMEPVVETGVEITNGWRKKDIAFTALVSKPEIYKVVDKNGLPVDPPDNGILIPERLSVELGLKPGDMAELKPYLPGKDKREVRVSGLIVQYLGSSAYGSMESVARIFGEGRFANSAVLKLDGSEHEKEVIEKLKKMPVVSSVQSKSDSKENLIKNMDMMMTSVLLMILLAAVLAVAVIYNIATINIFERQRELATLKVLGFKDNEVRNLIFNENYLLTAFGIILGLPLGRLIGGYMMSMYQTDAYTFPFIAGMDVYAITAVFIICFTILANLILRKKIKVINMVEVLKSNE